MGDIPVHEAVRTNKLIFEMSLHLLTADIFNLELGHQERQQIMGEVMAESDSYPGEGLHLLSLMLQVTNSPSI